ncbi:MAG TPA: STAS domain-containing protein [Solirubrobacteraceae bacterium]|nr:STAS domain-containing protein [Solirubrobacteraceae bacterium]
MGRGDRTELIISIHFDGLNTRVALEGELDLASAPRLERALNELTPGVNGHLLLDLEGLTFSDGAGLAAIERAAQELGSRLIVCGPRPRVREIIALTRLDERVQVEEQGAREISDIPAGNVAYVRRLWEAFEKGGGEHVVKIAPENTRWKPLGAAKPLRTSELQDYLDSRPAFSLTPDLVTTVGHDVLVTWGVRDGKLTTMWSLFRFHERQLVEALSFDSEPEAIAALRLFDRRPAG